MRKTNYFALVTAVATMSLAAQDTFPLPNTAPNTTATETTAAWLTPLRMSQTLVTNMDTLVATQGLNPTLDVWDMIALSPNGRYVFIPSESSLGAGVFRYDTATGTQVTYMVGNASGVRHADPLTWDVDNDDFARLDPCTYTPAGTIIVGEETTGGRMFEVTNPMGPAPYAVRWLDKIPSIAHEGTRFDSQGNLYVVDEDNSGCIYKFVPTVPGDLSAGQTFVLSVDAYATDANAAPSENYNSASNSLTTRVGPATWVPMTDAVGNALTVADPFAYVTTTGGRTAADELVGTPFGRPEDLDFNVLANGNECLYCTLTSEDNVISIEFTSDDTCMVRVFCDTSTIDLGTGVAVGGTFNNPDNLAVDADGSIYVIEDQGPGDIWKTIDRNKDGVAERIGRFVAQGVDGAEPSGMIFDPSNPDVFYAVVQHPSSGNDALWKFDTRAYEGSDLDVVIEAGINWFPTHGAGEGARNASAFDLVSIGVDSPNGSQYGRPFAVFMQPFVTASGQFAFLPPLWLNPFQPSFALVGGAVGVFPSALPYGGSNVAVTVPPGLNGLSIMLQGVTVDASGALFLTDGLEIVFN